MIQTIRLYSVHHVSKQGLLQIYEIPFFVALDHKREAVLVAVRGTLSLKVSWDSN